MSFNFDDNVEEIARREKLLSKRDIVKTDFRMCRRRHKTDASRITPWDSFDSCAVCGIEVVYDRQDSEGIPHLCAPCVERLLKAGEYPELSALLPDPITDERTSDLEIMKRMEATVSQNRHGENEGMSPEARGVPKPNIPEFDVKVWGLHKRSL